LFDFSQRTALFWSVSNGQCDLCEALLAAGADIDAKNSRQAAAGRQACGVLSHFLIRENTPLMHAARTGNVEMCRLLILNKADVNATNDM
jgi:ankyrin repeat protein